MLFNNLNSTPIAVFHRTILLQDSWIDLKHQTVYLLSRPYLQCTIMGPPSVAGARATFCLKSMIDVTSSGTSLSGQTVKCSWFKILCSFSCTKYTSINLVSLCSNSRLFYSLPIVIHSVNKCLVITSFSFQITCLKSKFNLPC
jgi:hypothetical protein